MIFFYLLVAIMPLVNHPIWTEIKLAGLTLNKCVGIVTLLVAVVEFLVWRRPVRPFATIQSWIFVMFAVLVMGSFLITGSSVPLEESPFGNWSSFLLLFFTASVLLTSRRRLRWVLLATVGGVAFASLHLIREWQNGDMAAGLRPGWVTGDPNYFALSALLCLPLGLLLAQQRRARWERIFYMVCGGITLLALTLAGSRGGFLGLLISGLVLAWPSRRRAQYLTLGALLLGALVILAPTSPLTRFVQPTYSDEESNNYRTALFFAGLRMFEDNFLIGVGVGNFKRFVGNYGEPGQEHLEAVAHDTYLEVGAELGIFGLLAFVATLYFSWWTLRRLRRQMRGGRDPFIFAAARGVEAGLIGACVAIFFLSALHARLLWFMVILSMCLPSLASIPSGRTPRPPRRVAHQASTTPASPPGQEQT
jgi:putative inorganic carbon (HCO3(-)) transporter